MPFRASVPCVLSLSDRARGAGSGPVSGAEAGADLLDSLKSVEALLCFEQSRCAWLPLSEQRGRGPAYLLQIWGLWLMTENLYWWQVTSQPGKDLLPNFNTGMKQGGLQTAITPLSYSVFLNCIGLNPHISRSWMAMLAMPALISAKQEIHLLFPHLPKPSWVPLHAQCPPRQGWLWGGSCPAAASLLPGKQLQCSHQPQWPPQQAVQMRTWCAGEAEHQMQGACWQVTGLHTSTLVGMWQQDQTCKVQWQIREHFLSHGELAVTLPFASGN